MFYADAVLAPGAVVPMPDSHEERAAYVVEGGVEIAGVYFDTSRMLLFRADDSIALRAGLRGPGCCCWVAR